jgi:hypothetical protein
MKMAEPISKLTRHDLEAKIVKRCWENEAFRKEFTADPSGTTVKYLGAPAASVPKIVVHEEPAGSWYIVLPPRPANMKELSDQQLESVSGASITNYTFELSYAAASVIVGVVTAAGSAAASAQFDPGW